MFIVHFLYDRLLLDLYGFFGKLIVNIIRGGKNVFRDFFEKHNVERGQQTAHKALELADLAKVKFRDYSEPGYILAVQAAFLCEQQALPVLPITVGPVSNEI